jgi:hypothetical protein
MRIGRLGAVVVVMDQSTPRIVRLGVHGNSEIGVDRLNARCAHALANAARDGFGPH